MAHDYWSPAYELMVEEARRSIDRQSERLQQVRQRAVGMVGFGSVVAAALGLGSESRLGVTGAVAVVAFVVVTGAALFVLVPREFQFEMGARRMDEWFDDPDLRDMDHLRRTLAFSHDENHAYNHKKIKQLNNAIAVGVGALFVSTLALVARLVL